MRKSPGILITALRDPMTEVVRLGGDPLTICRAAGVEPEASERQIPLASFVRFFQVVSSELSVRSFGWSAGATLDIRTLGDVGRAICQAPTVGAGLRLLCAAFGGVQDTSDMTLEIEKGEARLRYRILDPEIWPRDQDAELTLRVLTGYIRMAAGADWQPAEIWFEHRRRMADLCSDRTYSAPVRYGAPANALVFPTPVLDLRLPDVDAVGFRDIATSLATRTSSERRKRALADLVAEEIYRGFGWAAVSQEEIAARLGLSLRTLKRRLQEENRTFSAILASCRGAAATRLLADGRGIEATAFHLGYSETAAFSRAFRGWHGIPPGQWAAEASGWGS